MRVEVSATESFALSPQFAFSLLAKALSVCPNAAKRGTTRYCLCTSQVDQAVVEAE